MKDLDYQPGQLQQPDEELPLCIEPKDRFNELKSRLLSVKDNKLKTSESDNQYYFKGMKNLIKDITNNKIDENMRLTRSKKMVLM